MTPAGPPGRPGSERARAAIILAAALVMLGIAALPEPGAARAGPASRSR